MRVSRESSQLGWTRRGFRVKVNLPTFKDEKAKDAVTYHLWQWDISVFHCFSWDDHHLLPYVFRSLQGFPWDLARSLGEDATLGDVLQMLDKHYSVMMTFDALHKEFYSLKQGMGENVAEFEVTYLNRFRYSRQNTQQNPTEYVEMWWWWSGITSTKPLALSISECWPTWSMVKTLSPIPNCFLLPRNWKDRWKPETPSPENHYYWEFKHNSFSLTRKSISIQEVEG